MYRQNLMNIRLLNFMCSGKGIANSYENLIMQVFQNEHNGHNKEKTAVHPSPLKSNNLQPQSTGHISKN